MQTKSVTKYRILGEFPIKRRYKLLNVQRDGNKILLVFFAYILDKINYLRDGRIKLYITKEVMHYLWL